MPHPRRQVLRLVRDALVLSSAAWAASPLLAKRTAKRPAALLLPLTGAHAALGGSMRNAATLVESDAALLPVFDTGGTAEGAARAAQAAIRAGAGMLLGPLTGAETSGAAVAVGGRVPMLGFSNDLASRRDAFLLGITPSQATGAILSYARSRGVRRVLVAADASAWSVASVAAARLLEGELGLTVDAVTVGEDGTLPRATAQPDALFVPGAAPVVLAAARASQGAGVQILATLQGLDHRPESLAALDGAWIASPDPDRFATFARTYTERHGGRPGALAALAHDAAVIARTLRDADRVTRDGVLADTGFDCVTGPLRFRSDGSCARTFAILVAGGGGFEKVAESRGA